jgi:predicted MPP superfamily phosphohydrolase
MPAIKKNFLYKIRFLCIMNKIIAFSIFFSIFLAIYFGMHFYVFMRLSSWLAFRRNIWFYLAILIMGLIFPATSFIERFGDGFIARIFYTIGASWLGMLFLAFCAVLAWDIVRHFIRAKASYAAMAIIAIVILLTIYGIINALFLNVKEIVVKMPNLEKQTRIVQLSDMHVGTVHNSRYLEQIVKKTNSLSPDIVLITGDLVDGTGQLSFETYKPLLKLEAKTFFTTGNHEQYGGLERIMPIISALGIQALRDEVAEYRGIQIIGIDNPGDNFAAGNPTISKIRFDKKKPSVLMYHVPIGLEEANAAGINLQLSGHTHNGQIVPFNMLTRIFFPRTHGRYEYNGTVLYTTPGTGTWGPPMRIGSRNEITIIRLVKD